MARICMIAYTFYASDPRVRREAEALATRGDTVDFICLKEKGKEMRLDYDGVRLHPISAGRYQGGSTLSYLSRYLSFFVQSFFRVTFLFFKKRYDVIQVHTMPDFLVFAALIPKCLGAKVILDVHDLMPELYMCKFGVPPTHFFIRVLTWVEKRSIGFADKAIAVHVPHRDVLVAHGNPEPKFTVVLNVPDPKIFYRNGEQRQTDKFRLIYHGTVAQRHGLEVALKAVASIKDQIPGLEFLIIGGGDNLERIKNLVAEMKLDDKVRFVGTMPVEKLPDYLRQVDVGMVPILRDPFTRYMLPLKLMEYVGMGIPAIVSRTETIEAYFDDRMVYYCKPGDDRELAAGILALHADRAKRTELVSNASKFNSLHNWDREKQVYFGLVDSLVQSRHN